MQRRLKPSHHVMICKLLPSFRAPRCIDLLHKMDGQSSTNKSERHVVFFPQHVAVRKHRDSFGARFVRGTWHIWRGESEYPHQIRTIWHTSVCLRPVSILPIFQRYTGILRPTDCATVLALRTRGRKAGQEAMNIPLAESEVKAGDDDSASDSRPGTIQPPQHTFLNMNWSVL